MIRVKKLLLLFCAVSLILALGIFGYSYYMNYKLGKIDAKRNQKEIENIVNDMNLNEENIDLKPSDFYPEQDVYDIMHRMANTKIIAVDNKVWGELPIENKALDDLRRLIKGIDYADREYLLNIIDRWSNNDFSNAVEEHNYFWNKLGGTVGKAIELKEP